MNLERKLIRTNCSKGKKVHQITFDQDKIVPDQYPDIEEKISQKGYIKMETVRVCKDKVHVKGHLLYDVLYQAPGGEMGLLKLSGTVPVEESINMDGLDEGDSVCVDYDIDDLSIVVVNSRKISMKAIVTIIVKAEATKTIEAVTSIDEDAIELEQNQLQLTELVGRKKDLIRIKEEVAIDSGKENINQILWYTTNLLEPQIRVSEGNIEIQGELSVFILYRGEQNLITWVEAKMPFKETMEVLEAEEGLIPSMDLRIQEMSVDMKADYDGEARVFLVEAMVGVDVKLYEEHSLDIVTDLYSVREQILPVYSKLQYDTILMKNSSRCKIKERIGESQHERRMLQICNCSGEVKIDETSIADGGIIVDGVLMVEVIGVCENDSVPISCRTETVPFRYKVEVNDINREDRYQIRPWLENLQCSMVGGNELEIRASICMDCIAFKKMEVDVILDAKCEPYNMEEISKTPAVHAHIVQNGETMWKIAKKYYSSVDNIKKWNHLEEKDVKPGDMIMVVRSLQI